MSRWAPGVGARERGLGNVPIRKHRNVRVDDWQLERGEGQHMTFSGQ